MIGEEVKIFKIKKDLSRLLEVDKNLKRKIKILKNSIVKKDENDNREFYCVFDDCNKNFPNYTRWMLHYKMHVITFFSIFLKEYL